MNVVFFQDTDARVFFAPRYKELKEEIDRLSDAEAVSCDLQAMSDYLYGKYCVSLVVLLEKNIEKEISKGTVRVPNYFRWRSSEKEYYDVDGITISYKIPFDGDPSLFRLIPSSRIIGAFGTDHFIEPLGNEYGSFTLTFEYSTQELQNKADSMNEYVKGKFDAEFSDYRSMIEYVNVEANSYNSQLKSSIPQMLANRRKQADSLFAISAALQIPLIQSGSAPNTKPIQLKRVVRQPREKPSPVPEVQEHYICDSDYENINNIIWMCGTTMEKTARTYFSNSEEELRDHLLAALNTHYQNATGETFRKIGKTDIHIEFENKAAFIGECKIWHGAKALADAIQQVINYTTWRDVKVSVIIFNKKNSSFQSILSAINELVEENSGSHSRASAGNRWECRYHRKDIGTDIFLSILAFDLYVDATQFKDKRYNS